MKFTVTYRNNAGTVRTTGIEASSRADAFELLKARGIVPLTLVPGDAGPAGKVGWHKAKRRMLYAACVVAVIAICIAAICIFLSGKRAPVGPNRKGHGRIAEVPSTKKTPTAMEAQAGNAKVANNEALGHEIAKPVSPAENLENGNGKNDTFPTNRIVAARGPSSGRKVTLMDGTETVVKQKPIFKRDFERMLMAASRPGGLTMDLSRMTRIYSEIEIRKMLMEPVEINDDDDDHVVGVKLRVQQAKEELVEFLNKGGSVEEAIAQMQKQSRAENEERTASFKMLKELIADGNAEEIRNFVAERNKDHEKLGLPLLQVPGRFREDTTTVTSQGGKK